MYRKIGCLRVLLTSLVFSSPILGLTWSNPQIISHELDSAGSIQLLQVGMDGEGNTTALWTNYAGVASFQSVHIVSALLPLNGE